MKVFRESIKPQPERPTTDPNIWHDPNTLILYGSEARYRADTTYHFVVDLIPDYVFQNAARTKFCVFNLKFKESVKAQNVWRVIRGQPFGEIPRSLCGGRISPATLKIFTPRKLSQTVFLR